jgi:hypoxanthine-guanine phosphoribosyltransferase
MFATKENFRRIVKLHYEQLLHVHAQFLDWKKCCTARWMKLGEENTKYFHSVATIRYIRNNIVFLIADDVRNITHHEEMDVMALNCYKNRMGTSREIDM